MNLQFLPNFKVVEVNNLTALRSGHVLAQFPSYAADVAVATFNNNEGNAVKFLQNGVIVGLANDGKIKNYVAATQAEPMLVFTEELTYGPLNELSQFAEQFDVVVVGGEDTYPNPVYPRCLPLYTGDTFTTNNFDGAAANGYAKVVNGVITVQGAADSDTLFKVVKTKLPAGQVALECTYLGKLVPSTEA